MKSENEERKKCMTFVTDINVDTVTSWLTYGIH